MKTTKNNREKTIRSFATVNGSKSTTIIQRKLKIGKPNDHYEQEANQVADKVVSDQEPSVQRQSIEEEEEEMVQPKLNRDQTPWIQRQEEEEEEAQPKEKNGGIGAQLATPWVENSIRNARGSGNPLPKDTGSFMENRFDANFENIRVHTNDRAAQMNDQINAQAFTSGNDIFFNRGKYSPETQSGKRLLAHELTHTIQQTGMVQKKNTKREISTTNYNIQRGFWGKVWGGIKSVGSTAWSGVKSVAGYSWNVMKSAGAWMWNMTTETPGRIWRILKHIGSGIVGTVSWVWDGIKGALGHIWSAVKDMFSWLSGGIAGLFSWIWRGLKGGANWAYRLLNGDFSGFWEGIGSFFSWMGNGVMGLVKWGWDGLKGVVIWAWKGVKGFAKWIWRGFLGGAAWIGRLIAKLLDLVGFGEIMDLLFNIIKLNTRTLNSIELQEARKVFRGSISYWQVRIDEASLIALIGSLFSGGGGMGVTLFHTINFNKKINAAVGNGDMRWLIHELSHVAQYEHIGSQYIGEAIHAQATVGYAYGNGAGLAGKNLQDFNREQQADIIAHYYYYILSGNSDSRFSGFATDYNRMITQARSGQF